MRGLEKKSMGRGQTNKQTDRRTCNSMTESAQWADSVKIVTLREGEPETKRKAGKDLQEGRSGKAAIQDSASTVIKSQPTLQAHAQSPRKREGQQPHTQGQEAIQETEEEQAREARPTGQTC